MIRVVQRLSNRDLFHAFFVCDDVEVQRVEGENGSDDEMTERAFRIGDRVVEECKVAEAL